MVKYNCEKCKKEFTRKLYLKQHLDENICLKIELKNKTLSKSAKEIIEDVEKMKLQKKTRVRDKKKKPDKNVIIGETTKPIESINNIDTLIEPIDETNTIFEINTICSLNEPIDETNTKCTLTNPIVEETDQWDITVPIVESNNTWLIDEMIDQTSNIDELTKMIVDLSKITGKTIKEDKLYIFKFIPLSQKIFWNYFIN